MGMFHGPFVTSHDVGLLHKIRNGHRKNMAPADKANNVKKGVPQGPAVQMSCAYVPFYAAVCRIEPSCRLRFVVVEYCMYCYYD